MTTETAIIDLTIQTTALLDACVNLQGNATSLIADAIANASTSGVLLNSQIIPSNYTIPAGFNRLAVGPITLATGAVLTIPDGSRFMIL